MTVPDHTSWGRWGTDDELGSLNLIDEAAVLNALGGPGRGEVIELGLVLGPETLSPPHRGPIRRYMNRDGGDYAAGAKRPGGFQFAEDEILLPTHSGTHIDALAHAWHDDRLYNDHDPATIRSTTGAQHCGADRLKPIITRGVLLDFAEAGPLDAGHSITAEAIKQRCSEISVDLRPADAVLVRTGWMVRHSASSKDFFSGEPGVDLSAARYFAERDIAILGADNFAIEPIPFSEGELFPVHQHLLRDRGIPLLENLVLDRLAASGTCTFLFIALPLRFAGGTASPVNPVAVI